MAGQFDPTYVRFPVARNNILAPDNIVAGLEINPVGIRACLEEAENSGRVDQGSALGGHMAGS